VAVPEPHAERFGQLDALRGLAALAVFLGHSLGMLQPAPYAHGPVEWFMHSPFQLVVAGHQAVIFFFVISGFVLSLGFYSRKSSAWPFLVSRIFRLYPPYLAALAVVALLRLRVVMEPLDGFSTWINGFWLMPLKLGQLWPAVTMLADTHGGQLNPAAWSLIIEMRVSLFFPIVMILLLRFGWVRGLAFTVVLGCLAAIPSTSATDLYATLQYGVFFVMGAVLAQHRDALVSRCRSFSVIVQLGILAIAALLYTQSFWLAPASRLHVQPLDDLVAALGAAILIVVALGAPGAAIQLLPVPLPGAPDGGACPPEARRDLANVAAGAGRHLPAVDPHVPSRGGPVNRRRALLCASAECGAQSCRAPPSSRLNPAGECHGRSRSSESSSGIGRLPAP